MKILLIAHNGIEIKRKKRKRKILGRKRNLYKNGKVSILRKKINLNSFLMGIY